MATVGQLFAEIYRLRLMGAAESMLRECGYGRIGGVDEAGRGCLAGPVVAAAVVTEPGVMIPGVDDSKKLSSTARERLSAVIRRAHPAHAVAFVAPRDIDRMNILQATRRAMALALEAIEPAPDAALVDAVRLEGFGFPTLGLVRGDCISYAVACASVLAKVERDRLMVRLDRRFPEYDFASNKGYGAPSHRRALREHGPCPVHRLTFRSVLPRREVEVC